MYVTFTFISNSISISISESNSIDTNKNIDTIKEIIEYFNTVTGKNYKASSKTTQTHINARLNEGFSVEDFKKLRCLKTQRDGQILWVMELLPIPVIPELQNHIDCFLFHWFTSCASLILFLMYSPSAGS